MAKREEKINIELSSKEIDILLYGLQNVLSNDFKTEKLHLDKILNEAKAELVNQKPVFILCRKITMDFFRKITKGPAHPEGEDYPFTAVCGVHLKQLLKFFTARLKKKNIANPTPEQIGKSLQGFLDLLLELPDQWYIKNFSLKNLNSKKDEIVGKVAKLRNDKQDDIDKRKRKNQEYWDLRNRAEKLLKRYKQAFIEAEIYDRHGKVDFIFKGEQLDWSAEVDLRLLMLDLLEKK
jgi:hypothetical protein